MAPVAGAAGLVMSPLLGAISRLAQDPAGAAQAGLKFVVTWGGISMGLLAVRGWYMQRDGEPKPPPFDASGPGVSTAGVAPRSTQGTGSGGGGRVNGVSNPASTSGSLPGWISDGFKISGAFEPTEANMGKMRARIMQESGGNPKAVNNWDRNAARGTPSKGLVQIIKPTWEANAVPGYENFDKYWDKPRLSVATSLNYMKNQYGYVVGRTGGGY